MEPHFRELYQVLGDKEAQDLIREKHSDVKHCPLLRAKADACTGCPNNPHEREDAPHLAEADAMPVLAEAIRLHELAELGLLEPPLHPVVIELVRIARADALRHRMGMQADLIAARVAEMFGSSKT